MSGLKKWLEKRIRTLEASQEHLHKLLSELADQESLMYDHYIDRMISKGSKMTAYKEMWDYINTHEDQDG